MRRLFTFFILITLILSLRFVISCGSGAGGGIMNITPTPTPTPTDAPTPTQPSGHSPTPTRTPTPTVHPTSGITTTPYPTRHSYGEFEITYEAANSRFYFENMVVTVEVHEKSNSEIKWYINGFMFNRTISPYFVQLNSIPFNDYYNWQELVPFNLVVGHVYYRRN